MSEFDDLLPDEPEIKSKTQVKREMEALQALGQKLLDQKQELLDKMPLTDELRAAIVENRRIKQREARRRHLQYIGRLMRDVDGEAIQAILERSEAGSRAYNQRFHQLERWRDRLITEGATALKELLTRYPEADRQHLNQLIRNAQKEASQEKPPASARKLFKYLRELDELE